MKKKYHLLLGLACLTSSVFSQYVVQAPIYDGSSTRISGPSAFSTQKYQRSVFLITQTELGLMSLTNSVVTGFGFDMRFGTSGAAAAGNFTVYLENTSDLTYNKGLDFTVAITGMQQSYAGAMTIPQSNGGTTMGVTLANAFTYTGGGIYVAYDWVATAPADQVGAWTLANSSDLNPGGATVEGTALPAVATMTNTNFRPVFRLTAGNIAANELNVLRLDAPGIVSKLANGNQIITAQIKNQSAGTLNNIPVSLSITGANPFTSTQTITSLASGATATVPFSGYIPTTNGLSTLSVSIPADQHNDNNSYARTQSVTCNEIANNPPLAANTFSQNSLGFNTSGIISTKYTAPVTCSLTAIKLAMANATINTGNKFYGVLMDASGAIIATSATITANGGMLGTFVNFNFSPAESITGGTDYFLGIAIPTGPAYPCGTTVLDPYVTTFGYYASSITGGAVPTQVNRGYMGIQAVLGFSNTVITASASQTVVCKSDGPGTVTLTVDGGSTSYNWTPGNLTGSTVVVSPTVASVNGGNVNYVVTGTDAASGCKSNAVTVQVKVDPCTALSSNTSNGYDLKLFPNPATNGKATITGLVGTNVVTVYNTLGQIVLTLNVSEDTMSLDLSNQPSGNYLVKITDLNKESRLIKVVNQN